MQRKYRVALAAAVSLSLLAGCGGKVGGGGDDVAQAPGPTTTTSPPPANKAAESADDIANGINKQIQDKFRDFGPEELSIGSKNITFAGAAQERGTAAFTQRTLTTTKEVSVYLNENTDPSKAAKQRVVGAIKAHYFTQLLNELAASEAQRAAEVKAARKEIGTEEAKAIKAAKKEAKDEQAELIKSVKAKAKAEEKRQVTAINRAANARKKSIPVKVTKTMKVDVKRALNGSGYFPIQVNVAAQVLGTTYFQNGKVLEAGEWREVGPKDVFWLFMTVDNQIVFGATIRADCGNPNIVRVIPIRPNTPPAPPIHVPPVGPPVCPSGYQLTANGLCPKDPSQDINNNPYVPPGVVNHFPPYTIPVLPEVPHDTATGCADNKPCPTTQPQPTTPTAPPGGTVKTPKCGESGQPSCTNTGVTTPTTVAPPATVPNDTVPNNGTVPSR